MARMFFRIFVNDELARKELNRIDKVPYTNDCFGGLNNYYQGDDSQGNIYFGFPAHLNISKLVDEMNENFNNIKIIIVENKILGGLGCNLFYGNGKMETFHAGEYNYCLFKILLNDEYSQDSKYILSLTIAQFIRVYCPYYKHFIEMKDIENDFINNSLKAQNTSDYGAWLCCDPSENYTCSRGTFDKLDNIELVNSICANNMNLDDMPVIHKLIRVLDESKPVEYIRRISSVWE